MDERKQMITDAPSGMNEQMQSPVSEINQSSDYSSIGDNPAEAILSFIAYGILILGILVSLICGGLLIIDNYKWDNIVGWAILIGGLILSLIVWASLMILINISNNVRQIKYEIRNMKL